MRAIFSLLSLLSLLIVLLVVGLLAKRQLSSLSLVSTQNPPAANAGITLPATTPLAAHSLQSQQIKQQVKQSVEAAMQQPRAMPEEP